MIIEKFQIWNVINVYHPQNLSTPTMRGEQIHMSFASALYCE